MPGLVHHLGGGVELAVDVGNGLDDLAGADQRALLAVQELGELPGDAVATHHPARLLVHSLPAARPIDGYVFLRPLEWVLEVDLVRPVDALGGVPLARLALLVEVEQLVPPLVVLPVEDGRVAAGNLPFGLLNGQCVGAGAHE